MKREVGAEILDSLPADDPHAIRSRRDLRMINSLMGNERWIVRQKMDGDLIELGAGAGTLTTRLARSHEVTGLDFQECPEGLNLPWVAGDLFETLHFDDDGLEHLGGMLRERKKLVAVEPWRSRFALAEGALLFPLVNGVTRHDMMASIRAGFRKGELEALLKLGADWEWREEVSLLGGIRVLAWRR